MQPFSISFSPQSLSQIAQFAGFGTMLSDEVQQALHDAESPLIASIQGAMNWQNPTGVLSDSIAVASESQFEIIIGSDLPYAHRRDQGFVGADSLGRVYNDQGAFFMEQGMAAQQSAILASVETAVNNALNRLGAS